MKQYRGRYVCDPETGRWIVAYLKEFDTQREQARAAGIETEWQAAVLDELDEMQREIVAKATGGGELFDRVMLLNRLYPGPSEGRAVK